MSRPHALALLPLVATLAASMPAIDVEPEPRDEPPQPPRGPRAEPPPMHARVADWATQPRNRSRENARRARQMARGVAS